MKQKALTTLLLLVGVFAVPFLSVHAFEIPTRPTSSVSDFADVLSTTTESELEQKFTSLQEAKSIEIALVTVPDLDGETIETMSTKIFDTWGMGNEQYDTGLLILLAPNERKIRIEVGYGLEEFITDALAGRIIEKHTGVLSGGNYDVALIAIAGDIVAGLENASFEGIVSESQKMPPEVFFFLVIMALQLGAVMISVMAQSKSTWLGGILGGGVGTLLGFIIFSGLAVLIAISIGTVLGWLLDVWLSKRYTGKPQSKLPPWFGGGNGGFWGGHGGGSSSWGGFSGGSSGGGGASGSF